MVHKVSPSLEMVPSFAVKKLDRHRFFAESCPTADRIIQTAAIEKAAVIASP